MPQPQAWPLFLALLKNSSPCPSSSSLGLCQPSAFPLHLPPSRAAFLAHPPQPLQIQPLPQPQSPAPSRPPALLPPAAPVLAPVLRVDETPSGCGCLPRHKFLCGGPVTPCLCLPHSPELSLAHRVGTHRWPEEPHLLATPHHLPSQPPPALPPRTGPQRSTPSPPLLPISSSPPPSSLPSLPLTPPTSPWVVLVTLSPSSSLALLLCPGHEAAAAAVTTAPADCALRPGWTTGGIAPASLPHDPQ